MKSIKTIDELKKIEKIINQGKIPTANCTWRGADVIITNQTPPKSDKNNFYPEPRYVVTEFCYELSWLFEKLRDAFYAEDRLDGCSKIEFFGRLANTANRYIKKNKKIMSKDLCIAVLKEAFSIYEEMESGTFKYLTFAFGNMIYDDIKNKLR